MSETRRNRAVMRGIYEAYVRGDAGPLYAAMDETGRFQIAVSRGHFPFAGAGRGPRGTARVIAKIVAEYEWLQYELRELIAERDRVVGLTGGKIRHRATGNILSVSLVDVVRLRDGRIVEFDEYLDTAGLLHRQGHMTLTRPQAPAVRTPSRPKPATSRRRR